VIVAERHRTACPFLALIHELLQLLEPATADLQYFEIASGPACFLGGVCDSAADAVADTLRNRSSGEVNVKIQRFCLVIASGRIWDDNVHYGKLTKFGS
jgi:hypothetical protein